MEATVCIIIKVAASNKTTNFMSSKMEYNKDHKTNSGPIQDKRDIRLRRPLVARDEATLFPSRFLATILQFPRGE